MAFTPAPGERYTIRQKILKIFGAAFHIYNEHGEVVGYSKQKAFRFREDIRIYTDESRAEELLVMKARSILDFGATYDVTLSDGTQIASLRRRGVKSMFRDSWELYLPPAAHGQDVIDNSPEKLLEPVGRIAEDSAGLAIMRRVFEPLALLKPQRFHLELESGVRIATYRTHFNPFVYRLGVTVHKEHTGIDELVILASGVLIAAIEGRQSSERSGSGLFSGN